MKPIWVFTGAGQWRKVYDADAVERALKDLCKPPSFDLWAQAFTAAGKTSKED